MPENPKVGMIYVSKWPYELKGEYLMNYLIEKSAVLIPPSKPPQPRPVPPEQPSLPPEPLPYPEEPVPGESPKPAPMPPQPIPPQG
jgi:hypothetical protein